MSICEKEWKIGVVKLTVLPYFDCFQEPFEDQTVRLSHYNMKSMYEFVESEVASTSQSYNGQISIEPNDSSAGQQDHHTQDTESTDVSEDISKLTIQDTNKETYEKSAIIHYEQRIIPLILKILNIENALKETKFPSKVEVTSTFIDIEGSAFFVKKIHQTLSEKTFKVKIQCIFNV